MKPPKQIANPGLAALIHGAGFASLERFAEAVNARGWEMYGVKTSYDHITVQRWLAGSQSQNPDVVAAVLTDAWGVPVPLEVIWPVLRDGGPSIPATAALHDQNCRTPRSGAPNRSCAGDRAPDPACRYVDP